MKDYTELIEAARFANPQTPLERLLDEAFAEEPASAPIRPIETQTQTQTRPTIRPYGNQTSES